MSSFKINLGDSGRSLTIEADDSQTEGLQEGTNNKYKIFADEDDSWRDEESLSIEDVPVDSYLGTISIRSAKDFTFDGTGNLSGDDLLFITNQLVNHPSFNKKA